MKRYRSTERNRDAGIEVKDGKMTCRIANRTKMTTEIAAPANKPTGKPIIDPRNIRGFFHSRAETNTSVLTRAISNTGPLMIQVSLVAVINAAEIAARIK